VNTAETQPIADWREIDLRISASEVCIPHGAALDLGGTAKGWAAQLIADGLAEVGACLVDFGGDVVGRGAPDRLPGWPVEIEDPFTGQAFASVYLQDASIATSGTDFRHWRDANGDVVHHIVDPRTGKSAATDVLAVTVIHPQAVHAEAYAKAVLLQGAERGLSWLNNQWNGAGLVFRLDGATLANSRFTDLSIERNKHS
ncbi:MAG: FAD:protein FMN transferase, partial [Anaerolineae bacterium]|nr:FAD:protein FMN transferase [Anaerolineae bacterium]